MNGSSTKKLSNDSLPTLGFLLLAAISFIWGINWPMMKIALSEIPPWTFRMLCLVIGGAGLLALVKANGLSVAIPKREIVPLFLCAFLNVTGWHLCSAYGLVYMTAGRASIIAFTMPLWAAILSSIILHERLTMGRLVGLCLGLAGLTILIGPDIKALRSAPVGEIFMLVAAFSWGAGTVSVKYFQWTIPTTLLAGWQLFLGGIPVIIGALILDPITIIFQLSWQCILATSFVILMGIIFCYWAWFKVINLFPATLASIGILLVPIIGVFSSALVLGEPVGWRELMALALVVSALGIVMIRPEEIRRNLGRFLWKR